MTRHVNDGLLQQLIDGELDERRYNDVLAGLANEQDGWRRCALAFLEDQALRRELAAWRERQSTSAPGPAAPQRTASRVDWSKLALAMAASFLVAFVLGYTLRLGPNTRQHDVTTRPPVSGGDGFNMASLDNDGMSGNGLSYSSSPLGQMTLVIDGLDGRQDERIELPVYPLTPTTSRMLVEDQSAVSPELYEALERAGSEVRRQHFLAPITLQDGRQVVIPMEQVQILPIARTPAAY